MAYAALILSKNGVRPGQRISTLMSRGKERSEIESVEGSARTSMRVSDRPAVPSPLRASYPMTSATAGCPGRATESSRAALRTSGVFAATAATDSWK